MNLRSLINSEFDAEQNFWVLQPELKSISPFKAHYKKDRSKNKHMSGKFMWFVAFCVDPKSPLISLPLEGENGRLVRVSIDYMEDADFYDNNAVALDELMEGYKELTETPAVKSLRIWEQKMRERDQFLMDTEYTLGTIGDKGSYVGGTADTLDKMMANTPKLYEQLKKIQDMVTKESSNARGLGGSKASLSDSGEI